MPERAVKPKTLKVARAFQEFTPELHWFGEASIEKYAQMEPKKVGKAFLKAFEKLLPPTKKWDKTREIAVGGLAAALHYSYDEDAGAGGGWSRHVDSRTLRLSRQEDGYEHYMQFRYEHTDLDNVSGGGIWTNLSFGVGAETAKPPRDPRPSVIVQAFGGKMVEVEEFEPAEWAITEGALDRSSWQKVDGPQAQAIFGLGVEAMKLLTEL
ncbi:MAG TPA: hypothetical protein VMU97_01995 [Candidatus Dormibacteraeota bacterium]|nr:hypothetical protein [Candidatus Dormibacteraeota bacterium]